MEGIVPPPRTYEKVREVTAKAVYPGTMQFCKEPQPRCGQVAMRVQSTAKRWWWSRTCNKPTTTTVRAAQNQRTVNRYVTGTQNGNVNNSRKVVELKNQSKSGELEVRIQPPLVGGKRQRFSSSKNQAACSRCVELGRTGTKAQCGTNQYGNVAGAARTMATPFPSR